MMEVLATSQAPDRKTIIIGATYLEAHCTLLSLGQKGGPRRLVRRANGGMNAKPQAVADVNGRPIIDSLPKAQWMPVDRRPNADWLRYASQEKELTPCENREQHRQI
jgi:hypothetical protein